MIMKKLILTFGFLLFSIFVFSQKVITMEPFGSLFRVSCSVNGARMKMIFDTGASAVSLSESMASYLYDNDYITKDDIIGKTKVSTASGQIVDAVRVNLKDIEIQGIHLKNVEATVTSGQDVPLLLGQSAIQQLGKVTLDGNKLIIQGYSDEQVYDKEAELYDRIESDFEDGSWASLRENILSLEKYEELGSRYLSFLVLANSTLGNDQETINIGKRWLSKYQFNNDESEDDDYWRVYYNMAYSYNRLHDDQNALSCYEKSLNYIHDNPYLYGNISSIISTFYFKLGNYYTSISYCKKAIQNFCKSLKITKNQMAQGLKKDGCLSEALYNYSLCEFKLQRDSEGDYLMYISSKCGSKDADDYCRENKIIKPKSFLGLFD